MVSQLFSLISAKLISPLVSFLLIVVITRMWGQAYLGKYNTVWVWLTIFQHLSLFGISEFVARDVGANRSQGATYLTHGLIYVLLCSLVCAAAMIGGVLLFQYPPEVKYGIIAASVALPFLACSATCQAVFTALQQIKLVVFPSVVENLLLLVLGLTAILKGYSLITLIWCLVLSRFIGSALNLFIAQRFVGPLRFRIDWGFIRRFLAPVAVFGLSGLAYWVFMRIDVVMLSKMTDMATVGLYSAAYKLVDICLMLPLNFYFLSLPVAALLYREFPDSPFEKMEARLEVFFILIFFVFGFGALFADHILGIIYGQPFREAAWMLRVLMLGFLIQSSDMVLGMFFQAAGYQKLVLTIAIIRSVANVGLNFLLIPAWGGLGAALATLLSVSVSFAVAQYFLKNTRWRLPWSHVVFKPALICLSLIVLHSLLADRLNIVLLALIFILGYSMSLFGLNGFSLQKAKISIFMKRIG